MRSSRTRTGFALPAVLAVTGVVTLIFLVAMTALATLTSEAASARARVRFSQRALSAEALIVFMAATEPVRNQGFATGAPRSLDVLGLDLPISTSNTKLVRLDGRPYTLRSDGLTVSLQDQAGQINIDRLSEIESARFLAAVGAPQNLARSLTARLRDYTDADDLASLNGAERGDYRQGVPANRSLLRPVEWLSVLGAREAISPSRWRAARDDIAADPTDTAININTLTPLALQVRFGMTAREAQAVVTARERAPLLSLAELMAIGGGAATEADPFQLYTFPSGRVNFVIRDAQSPWIYRGRITLTPGGVEQPVWIDQTETIEAPRRAVPETSNAADFPYAPR